MARVLTTFAASRLGTSVLALLLAGCSASSERSAARDAGELETDSAPDRRAGGCGTDSLAITACVDQQRLREDVTFIAAPRPPGSPHWQAVQDLCAERFQRHGFEVERHPYGTGVNVIGKRRGSKRPDEQLVISAHYDHIADCSGADDNATGVAAVLETARVLEQATLAGSVVLACWDEEERGLLGARAYAKRAKARGDQIVTMTSLEMIGFKSDAPNSQQIPTGFELLFSQQYAAIQANEFRGDFVSVVALDSAAPLVQAFAAHAKANALPSSILLLTASMAASRELTDLGRSDHAAFWLEGFPAVMLNDSANFRYAQYHCRNGDDVPGLLDFDFLTKVTRANVAAQLELAGLR